MPSFECPSCALEVEGSPEACPYCGYEFPERSRGVGALAWLMAALMLIPVLWVLSRLL
jgi:hypothetical protein